MLKKIFVLLFFCFSLVINSNAQTCTTLGQNPSTAFPVCGTTTFSQTTVPFCGGRNIAAPPCPVHLSLIKIHFGISLPVLPGEH